MKARTLLLLAAALGLILFIVLFESKGPTTEERKEREKKVFIVKDGDISGLKFSSPDSSWAVRKVDGKWRLTSPLDYPADETILSELLNSITGLEWEKKLEGGSDLKTLGLKPAMATLTFTTPSGSSTLALGAVVAGTARIAALDEQKGTAYFIPDTLTKSLRKTPTELRSKEIFSVDTAQVAAIELVRMDRKNTLQKGPTGWTLDFPFPDRANREGVEDLLFGFSGLRAKEFMDPIDDAKLKALGLMPPFARIAFFDKDKKSLLEASLGRADTLPKNDFYVKRGNQVFLTSHALWEKLEKGTLVFPDPKLLGLQRWEVDRLEMSVGKEKKVLERKDGDWSVGGKKPALQNSMDDLLDHLANLMWMENYKTPKLGPVEITLRIQAGGIKTEAEISPDKENPSFLWAKVSDRPNWWKVDKDKIDQIRKDFQKFTAAP